MDGKTQQSKRMEMVKEFNNGFTGHTVFILSCKAGGCGLNLIGANCLIMLDIDWNPANGMFFVFYVWVFNGFFVSVVVLDLYIVYLLI